MTSSSNTVVEKSILHDWIVEETRALDLVASWERLCDAYRSLEFTDPINDTMKMEEFKWIIAEMNKHLSRARTKLLTCSDPISMIEVLSSMYTSTNAKVTNRKDLTYHKLRQIWVEQTIARLKELAQPNMEMEEENQDGKPFWDE